MLANNGPSTDIFENLSRGLKIGPDTEIFMLDTGMIKQPYQNYGSPKTNNLLLDMDFCGDSDMTLPLLASGGAVSSVK